MQRSKSTILGAYETTPVYRAEAPEDGPTVVVVGGIHGNEVTGYQAAELIRLWSINRGTLIVIPRANRPAIEAGTRSATQYNQPDINRCFPADEQPTHGIARGVWRVIENNDADYVFDLHRSKGLYRRSPSGVGMAIFPTPDGRDAAEKSLQHLNVGHVPDGKAEFRVGNDQTGANPLLSHKVGADRDHPGWLVETTYYDQGGYTQRDQLEHAVEALLYHCGSGIRVEDYGHHEHDPSAEVLAEYGESGGDFQYPPSEEEAEGSDGGTEEETEPDPPSEQEVATEAIDAIAERFNLDVTVGGG